MLNNLKGENNLVPSLRKTLVRKDSKGILLQKPSSRMKLKLNEDLYSLLKIIDGKKTILDIERELRQDNGKIREIILSLNKDKIIDLNVEGEQEISFCEYPFSYPLDMVYFEPTEKCNFGCIHCYASAPTKKDFSNELDEKGLENLMGQLTSMGVLEVCFTGGEPFYSKKTMSLSREFCKKGMSLGYITNASLINEEIIEELGEIMPSFIRISFHDCRKEVFERITGTNRYEVVLKNILKLREKGIFPAISCTMFNGVNNSFEEIKNYLAFFKEKGFEAEDIFFDEFVPDGCGESRREYVIDEVKVVRNIENAFLDVFNYNPRKKKNQIKDSYCGIGVSSLAIKSNGDITLCPVLSRPILGNLQESNLREIWENSDSFKYFREKEYLKESECANCLSLENCLGGCKAKALTLYGSMNSKDPWMCANLENDTKN